MSITRQSTARLVPHPPVFLSAGEHLAPHTPSILSAIAAGTTHPSPLVQTAALTAIEPLLPFVTDDLVPGFHQLLAALLPCAQAAVTSGNEDLLVLLCQVSNPAAACRVLGHLCQAAAVSNAELQC